MSNKRIKNDENKIILSTHYAFNKTFEQIEPFDLAFNGVYYTRSANLEDIIRDYERAYKLFKEFHPKHAVTIFDKALCIGLILRNYTTFGSSKEAAPRRVAYLNERFIAEVMLAFLHYSEYSIRDEKVGELLPTTQFNFEKLTKNHQEEFNSLLRKLIGLLAENEYKANEIANTLKEIYDLAILYGHNFDPSDFAKLSKRIRTREKTTSPNFNLEDHPIYVQHQESMKGKYRRR